MVCAEHREPLIPAEAPDCSPCARFQVVLNKGGRGGERSRLLWMYRQLGRGLGQGMGKHKMQSRSGFSS